MPRYAKAWMGLLLLLGCAEAVPAQTPAGDRAAAIREALRSGGHYAATVLLDEQGKARGDYDLLEGRWHMYEPAWHTGQLINGLLAAYEILGDEALLAAARRGGDWWVSLAITDPPALAGYVAAVHGDNVGDLIAFATISDGTPGLFRLYRHTGDARYADVPTRAGQWALDHLYLPDEGLLYDVVDVHTGEIWTNKSAFVEGGVSVHEVARPNNEGYLYLDMYRYSGAERYRDMFLALSESLLEKQHENGLWMDYHPNDPKTGSTHPRFNIWYAESLVMAYELTDDRRYLEAAARTARAVQTWQRPDGRIYYRNYLDGTYNANSLTGSAVSFAGILWLMLERHGYTEFSESIERSVDWVLANRFAEDHPDPNLRGGFFESRTRHRDGRVWLRVRDIATAFGLRFLADYYQDRYADTPPHGR